MIEIKNINFGNVLTPRQTIDTITEISEEVLLWSKSVIKTPMPLEMWETEYPRKLSSDTKAFYEFPLGNIPGSFQREGVTHAHLSDTPNPRGTSRKDIQSAATGNENKMREIRERVLNHARIETASLATSLQETLGDEKVENKLNSIIQEQVQNGIPAWIQEHHTDMNIQLSVLGRRIAKNAQYSFLFQESANGNDNTKRVLAMEAQAILQSILEEHGQQAILELATIKIQHVLQRYIQDHIQIPNFLERSLGTEFRSYMRNISHNLVIDTQRRITAEEKLIDPKPTHDIRYVFPDFPMKQEEETELEYKQRLQPYLLGKGILIGHKDKATAIGLRTTLLSLMMQGKNHKEIADILQTPELEDSIGVTISLMRKQFERYILQVSLIPVESTEDHTYPKRLPAQIKKNRCEGMEFMGHYYALPEWIQEYVKNKDKKFRKRK